MFDSDASPLEIDVPAMSGALTTMGYVAPPLRRLLRPLLEKRGRKVKEQLMARKAGQW